MHNGALSHVDDGALANKKLLAFYFSAQWCGPLSQVHSSTGRLLQARRSRTSRIRDRLLQQGPITIRDGKVHARGKHALAGNRLFET
jgi:hypothetical protein